MFVTVVADIDLVSSVPFGFVPLKGANESDEDFWGEMVAFRRPRSMIGIRNTRNVRLIVFAYDLGMSIVAMYAALVVRLGNLEKLGPDNLVFGALVPFCAAVAISLLVMRTYRTSWRHASTADLINIFYTVSLAVLIYLPLSFAATRLGSIPRSSVVVAWMVLFLLMAGSRVGYRLFRERALFFRRRPMLPTQVPILIVGGGTEAEIFLRSLDASPDYYPVGVLAETGHGTLLRGVPILGGLTDVERIVERFADAGDRPRKLVVVDRSLSPATLNSLLEISNGLGLTIARGSHPTQLRPGTFDAPELRSISVEDLLGRPQLVLDDKPVRDLLVGKRVLVTGAGGSIGSEIVRQICTIGPAAIALVDASEFNLYEIDAEVGERWATIGRECRILDVRNLLGLENCFQAFRPDIVFHAAALKHVPLVEDNPLEGIWTNAIGSRNVCDAALAADCHAVVMISTDKAVNPTNVMGATKRCAESYCQALALARATIPHATKFVAVRFGNVLGSAGSVVPLFERQLRAGGPLTVTHPDIERYFMTIREAVQLVLQASALGTSQPNMDGKVFILDMGRPVKIAELARQMIRLAGRQVDKEISIKFVGLRPGEKLSEELSHVGEGLQATLTPGLNIANPRTMELECIRDALQVLERKCVQGLETEAVSLLRLLVPEYSGQETAPARAIFDNIA